MTRLSESSQNKTAHRDQLMVGSFLVGEELVRFVVLVGIVNLVRPTVEDFLGFLSRLTIEAQPVLLKGGKGGNELAELTDCLHILRAHICNALDTPAATITGWYKEVYEPTYTALPEKTT